MIVKLNNQVLFKSANSFPRTFETVRIRYNNDDLPKSIKDRNNKSRPIFEDNGVTLRGDISSSGAEVYIKNLHLKSFSFPELK